MSFSAAFLRFKFVAWPLLLTTSTVMVVYGLLATCYIRCMFAVHVSCLAWFVVNDFKDAVSAREVTACQRILRAAGRPAFS